MERRRLGTRSLNVAAFALAEGAELVGVRPAGRGLLRFELRLADGQGEDVAQRLTASPVATFLAARERLLDTVHENGGPGETKREKAGHRAGLPRSGGAAR